MKIFLINLARRPDRLREMQRQASRLGLELTRLEAVDARSVTPPPGLFAPSGPLGEIPRGDQCCTLSHVAAWKEFLAGEGSHAVILEDDVVLSPGADFVLRDADWIPPHIDLIKLEHYGPRGQSVLLSDLREVGDGFQLGRMQSRHTGAAAYILSRRAAEILLGVTRFTLPVDHLMFNPNNSPLFAHLAPWQLLPAVARQQNFVGVKSDIEATRLGMRKLDATYVKRELVRFGYDLRLLPRQLALVASGRAKFMRVAK